jgi:hypothetical protein
VRLLQKQTRLHLATGELKKRKAARQRGALQQRLETERQEEESENALAAVLYLQKAVRRMQKRHANTPAPPMNVQDFIQRQEDLVAAFESVKSSILRSRTTWFDDSPPVGESAVTEALEQLGRLKPDYSAATECTELLWFSLGVQDYDSSSLFRWLHTRGTRIDCKNSAGSNLAHEACRNDNEKVLRLLVQLNHTHLFEDEDAEGASCVTVAVKCGHVSALKVLIESAVAVTGIAFGPHKRNLAHIAAEYGQTDAALWAALGRQQVNLLKEDALGKLPEDLAREGGHIQKFVRDVPYLGWRSDSIMMRGNSIYKDDFE